MCVIKTSLHRFNELETVVLELHNYDQPQLIALEIRAGNEGYLKWMAESLT